MILLDIAARLNEFDDDGVIYAERIDGDFTPDSRAFIHLASAEDGGKSATEIAAKNCPGLEYCLEIWIAKDAIEVWSQWRDGRVPTHLQAAEAVCHKANFDAWGPPAW